MLLGIFTIFILFLIYNLLPNVYYRNFSNQVTRHVAAERGGIALTFDDGPDPKYTPKLLDLLGQYHIKCTFFLVADKAFLERELVERIITEGHSIGVHSKNHRSAWLSFPWQTRADFDDANRIFGKLGVSVKLFRPPWGTFNLITQRCVRANGWRTVLWSLNARDWSCRTTERFIANSLIKNAVPGDIIVLHDSSGASGAPDRTITALETIIPTLLKRGFHFVKL